MEVLAKSEVRTQFFDAIFGAREGWVCIATTEQKAPQASFKQKFFEWPKQFGAVEEYILKCEESEDRLNVYYCVNLLEKPERRKPNCLPQHIVWADLDEFDPAKLSPPANIIVRTSPNRWQALWLLTTDLGPDYLEQYSKRIAYAHADEGVDKSGWDLTQLLRVPFTQNYKHDPPFEIEVMLVGTQTKVPPLAFETLPKLAEVLPNDDDEIIDEELPDVSSIPGLEAIIYRYHHKLAQTPFTHLFTVAPSDDEDWSGQLWKLIHICLENGITPEETFVICCDAKCNKYKRDKRPMSHLWRDIQKAVLGVAKMGIIIASQHKPLEMPMIFDSDIHTVWDDTFITRYREWATISTDAIPTFHDLAAFIMLSSIISNSVRLDTQYGSMVPNLWGMVLGDSTLSRKTTSMLLGIQMLQQLDPELIVATDGSAEGILTALETRPFKSSMFYKDEISGFLDSINRREYLAGMPETLTALYDVPPVYTRRLRKENIRIESPIFIFFGGGVRDKVYENLTEEYVLSGFLPRFLIVSGDTDMSRLRTTGPPQKENTDGKQKLMAELADLIEFYNKEVVQRIAGQVVTQPPRISAHLTDDAWKRYQEIEELMVLTASQSNIPNLALPTFERLTRSLLKMCCLIAASRQEPVDQAIMVEEKDVNTCARYIQVWGNHSIEAIMNAGKRVSERMLDKITKAINNEPGILRSTLMQHYHLTKREADEILGTLEDRMVVRKEKVGRGLAYYGA